ncbi:zinc finger protein SNAI2 [Lates japonicus]|uniref:Zinc finger protein SNAI2 n=1 Tax=Lates japonicus TaxID=270547 RepID=A0AAD3NGH1_LATJO|nr:zinc finger protein SNAI2 [Lates japonicus]
MYPCGSIATRYPVHYTPVRCKTDRKNSPHSHTKQDLSSFLAVYVFIITPHIYTRAFLLKVIPQLEILSPAAYSPTAAWTNSNLPPSAPSDPSHSGYRRSPLIPLLTTAA